MKSSEVYLQAAKSISRRNNYSCNVIFHISKNFKLERNYIELFRKNDNEDFLRSLNLEYKSGYSCSSIEIQNHRVLALLFMSEIAKESE